MAKKEIKLSQDLKFLQTKLAKLQSQRDILKKEVNDKKSTLGNLELEIKSLQEAIDKMTAGNDDLIFSEHSILRYIERVMGIDIEELKEKILPKKERQSILKTSSTLNFKKDGVSFRIKDGVIVTITGEN